MEITWFGINTSKSWNHFLVHRDGPFDMVLGSTWIEEDSLVTFSQPALALRMTINFRMRVVKIRTSLQWKVRCGYTLSNPPHWRPVDHSYQKLLLLADLYHVRSDQSSAVPNFEDRFSLLRQQPPFTIEALIHATAGPFKSGFYCFGAQP